MTYMKATELMIGDWVGRVFDDKRIEYRQVDWIRTGEIGMRYQKIWAIGCIEPIPLTPEILVKNGFDPETFLTSEWEKEVYFKEFSSCVVEPDDSGKYIFVTTIYWNKTDGDGSPIDWGTMYDSRICNLQYVHELQQALRLAGLNELADNFKV